MARRGLTDAYNDFENERVCLGNLSLLYGYNYLQDILVILALAFSSAVNSYFSKLN